MANTKTTTNTDYIPVGKTTSIKFTSRASVCVDKNYFTVEACEERTIPDIEGYVDIEAERQDLWNTVNEQCDNQIADIFKAQGKR